MTMLCKGCKYFNPIEFELDANKGLGLCQRSKSGHAVNEDDPACQQFEAREE